MSDEALLPADERARSVDRQPHTIALDTPALAAHSQPLSPTLPRRPLYTFSKRALDLTVALTLGVMALPVLFAIALAVRLDSAGHVLLRQSRVGRDGRPFDLLKFRSMRAGEPPNEALVDLNVTHGPTFKAPNDPRLTRVGRFIRRTSLDELPQLWNVLRGEMSLVGPRPLVVAEDAQLPEHVRLRTAVKPGMTGAWQVAGRSLVPFDEWMELDLEYVRSRGMRRDIAILARTPWVVVSRRGAY